MTTALEFVRGLGLGWNLGNTFDPVPLNDERNKTITTGGVWTPEDQQRLWFNKPFTRDCAFFVKEAGFDTAFPSRGRIGRTHTPATSIRYGWLPCRKPSTGVTRPD